MKKAEKRSTMYERMAHQELTQQVDYERSLGSGSGARYARKLAARYREQAARLRARGE